MHLHCTMQKNWTSKLKLSNTQCQQHWRDDTIWVQQQNGCESEITSLLLQQLRWQPVNQSAQLTVTGCNWTTAVSHNKQWATLRWVCWLPLCHKEAKMKKNYWIQIQCFCLSRTMFLSLSLIMASTSLGRALKQGSIINFVVNISKCL